MILFIIKLLFRKTINISLESHQVFLKMVITNVRIKYTKDRREVSFDLVDVDSYKLDNWIR